MHTYTYHPTHIKTRVLESKDKQNHDKISKETFHFLRAKSKMQCNQYFQKHTKRKILRKNKALTHFFPFLMKLTNKILNDALKKRRNLDIKKPDPPKKIVTHSFAQSLIHILRRYHYRRNFFLLNYRVFHTRFSTQKGLL